MPDVIGIDHDLLAGAEGVKHTLKVCYRNALASTGWATPSGDADAIRDVKDDVPGRIQDRAERLPLQAPGEDRGVDHRENFAWIPDVRLSRS
jgi:hypothetical protein